MSRPRSCTLVALTILSAFTWCFGRSLLLGEVFAFRDTANYYDPLFHWQCGEWNEGRVPLWNPYDDLGTPALAETTSSTFYPGKLLFALPLGFRLNFNLYVSLHVLLAAWTAFRLARHWRCTTIGAGMASVAYAFGGNVLFQYCNVVFLVGAAWLPLAVLATDRMIQRSSYPWAVGLGAVLALMVLGGDPQLAYNAGLMAALYALLAKVRSKGPSERRCTIWTRRGGLLGVAATVGAVLAAVQILPAAEWSRHSDRATFDDPRSIYEAAALWLNDSEATGTRVARGLFGTPAPGTHHAQVYDYSVGPWRLAECVWPNLSGGMFPQNSRWLNALPAEGRTWTPSLYMGLLPLALALGCWRLRRGPTWVRWCSWTLLLSVLGSFGWFGVGWLINEFRLAATGDARPLIGGPVGGVYWLLVTLLPGYAYFRYPAKLLVFAALAGSLLAGRGTDRLLRSRRGVGSRGWGILTAVSALLGATVYLLQGQLPELWGTPTDTVFGPLNAEVAITGLPLAFGHTTVVACAIACVLRGWPADLAARRGPALLVLTVVELCIANGGMIRTVAPSEPARSVQQADGRVWRGVDLPSAWSEAGSRQRLHELAAWEHETLFGKQHLGVPVAKLNAFTTVTHRDIVPLNAVTSRLDSRCRAVLAALSVDRLLMPDGEVAPSTNVYPRAWIVRDVEFRQPAHWLSAADRQQRLIETFVDDGQPRDLRRSSFIEGDEPASSPTAEATDVVSDACELVSHQPQRVELSASLSRPGWVVLNDLPYPGWRATIAGDHLDSTRSLHVHPANVVMRAVYLPAGAHRVVFRYRPASFYVGAFVSILGWLGVVVACFAARYSRMSRTTSP